MDRARLCLDPALAGSGNLTQSCVKFPCPNQSQTDLGQSQTVPGPGSGWLSSALIGTWELNTGIKSFFLKKCMYLTQYLR